MNPESVMLNEIGQTSEDRHHNLPYIRKLKSLAIEREQKGNHQNLEFRMGDGEG
jgi:hypothetical protein